MTTRPGSPVTSATEATRPSRVSIVIGARFHAFELARQLSEQAMLHRLVTCYPRREVARYGIPREQVAALPLTFAIQKLLERGAPNLAPKAYASLNRSFSKKAARELEGTEILHGWSGYSLESLHWAKHNRVPCVLERSSAHIVTQMELLGREYADLGVRFEPSDCSRDLEEYEMADLIAVPSLFAVRSFVARGFAESKLLYAPFGTDLSKFSPGRKSDDVFRVVYAGAVSIQKGVHHLVDAFNLVDIPHSELCIIGSTTVDTPVVLRRANKRLRRVPHLSHSELVQQYRNASVFVMASIQEGMALVQAQALASGLPLICSANTGGEDLLQMSGAKRASHAGGIDEYDAGYVVPARDATAIARCLAWLSSDADLLAQKGAAAASIRSQGLGWSDYAVRVIQGYKQLLAA